MTIFCSANIIVLNLDDIPAYFLPFKYTSVVFYSFQLLMRNEYEGLSLTCRSAELTGPSKICPITQGDQVLDLYNIDMPIWECFVVLIALAIGFRILGFAALYATAHNRKEPKRVVQNASASVPAGAVDKSASTVDSSCASPTVSPV
jgi:hypothetical protein